jgi:hypothetical protein
MIRILYHVNPIERESELEWLRAQKIFPSHQEYFDWATQKLKIRIGLIVSPQQATLIKLRHSLDEQVTYKQK